MGLHRGRAHEQVVADFGVGPALGHGDGHLTFAFAELSEDGSGVAAAVGAGVAEVGDLSRSASEQGKRVSRTVPDGGRYDFGPGDLWMVGGSGGRGWVRSVFRVR